MFHPNFLHFKTLFLMLLEVKMLLFDSKIRHTFLLVHFAYPGIKNCDFKKSNVTQGGSV